MNKLFKEAWEAATERTSHKNEDGSSSVCVNEWAAALLEELEKRRQKKEANNERR